MAESESLSERLKRQLATVEVVDSKESESMEPLIAPDKQQQPKSSEFSQSLREKLTKLKPDDTIAPPTGTLSFGDRIQLSLITNPTNRAMFLKDRGLSPDSFDEQDANEGLFGLSIKDIADVADIAGSIGASVSGTASGAAAGAALGGFGGPLAPVTVPAGGIIGGVVGGAGGGAAYDLIREQIAKSVASSNLDDSQLWTEVISGGAGPLLKYPVKAAGKGLSKLLQTSEGAQKVGAAISAMSSAVKNRAAGTISLLTGADAQAVRAFMDDPIPSLKLAGQVKKNPGELIKLSDDVIKSAGALEKKINKQYAESLSPLKDDLKALRFRNGGERVVETIDPNFVDNLGNPITSTAVQTEASPLVKEAADFLGLESAETLMSGKPKDLLKRLSLDQQRAIPKEVLNIIKKPELSFNDLEFLRKTRNSLIQDVSAGKTDAKAGLALMNKLYNKAAELPAGGGAEGQQALAAFRNLNQKFAPAYDKLESVTDTLIQGRGSISKVAKSAKDAGSSTDILKQAEIGSLRNNITDLEREFDPSNALTKKFNTLTGVISAQNLFSKDIGNKVAQRALTGSFIGSQVGGSTGSVIGGALGAASGIAGNARGVGQLLGAGTGLASPLGQASSRELLESTSTTRRLGLE